MNEFIDFVHCPGIVENITFRKPYLLPSSGERLGGTYSVGSVRKSYPQSLAYKISITISRFSGILTMTYNTETYWIFGLFPSSGILENRKHDVSETGSVSVLR
jgi:hypothetical protein